MPQIMLAVEGLFEFHIKTNPFGGGDPKARKKAEEEKVAKEKKLNEVRSKLGFMKLEMKQKMKDKQKND